MNFNSYFRIRPLIEYERHTLIVPLIKVFRDRVKIMTIPSSLELPTIIQRIFQNQDSPELIKSLIGQLMRKLTTLRKIH